MRTGAKLYTALIFIFLYAPIAVMLFFSFNSGSSTAVFEGFSLKWYAELFSDAQTLNAVKNTLILAVSSSAIATVVGTAAAFGIHHMKSRYLRQLTMSVTNVPMMNPDIVTGVSVMLLFVAVAGILSIEINKKSCYN